MTSFGKIFIGDKEIDPSNPPEDVYVNMAGGNINISNVSVTPKSVSPRDSNLEINLKGVVYNIYPNSLPFATKGIIDFNTGNLNLFGDTTGFRNESLVIPYMVSSCLKQPCRVKSVWCSKELGIEMRFEGGRARVFALRVQPSSSPYTESDLEGDLSKINKKDISSYYLLMVVIPSKSNGNPYLSSPFVSYPENILLPKELQVRESEILSLILNSPLVD